MKIATALGVLPYLCTLFVLPMVVQVARSACRVNKTKMITAGPDDERMMKAVERGREWYLRLSRDALPRY